MVAGGLFAGNVCVAGRAGETSGFRLYPFLREIVNQRLLQVFLTDRSLRDLLAKRQDRLEYECDYIYFVSNAMHYSFYAFIRVNFLNG